jgi:hypothetical protein
MSFHIYFIVLKNGNISKSKKRDETKKRLKKKPEKYVNETTNSILTHIVIGS